MAFSGSIAMIPYASIQPNASGILAPILRATGHYLFVAACVADGGDKLTPEEIGVELRHAKDHFSRILEAVHDAPITQTAKDYILNLADASGCIYDEWDQWDKDDQVQNLRAICNRCAALTAFLDFECMGLRNSDPGQSL